MTAKELIKLLKTLKPNTQITFSRDAEGNSFHTFGEISLIKYEGDKQDSVVIMPSDEILEPAN